VRRRLQLLALVGLGFALAATADLVRDAIALDVPEEYQPMMAVFFWPSEVPTVAAIISCESSWNATAKNPASSASGLLQFLRPTWRDTRLRLGVELRPFDTGAWTQPHQQFAAARAVIDERGFSPWAASARCWS
jgi:hypothetical protein